MAISHATATRDAIVDTVTGLIDGGAGAGTIEFQTAGSVEVATCTFSADSFPASSGGSQLANAITDDTNATGNGSAVTKFVIKNGSGVEILSGTVATSGADINLSSTVIGSGDTVSITSLQYTAPV